MESVASGVSAMGKSGLMRLMVCRGEMLEQWPGEFCLLRPLCRRAYSVAGHALSAELMPAQLSGGSCLLR